MTWRTGGRYDGEYVNDKMTGYGMMTWADGRRYEGQWLEGRCTGHGVTTFKSGSRYVGSYVMDKMQGRGCYSFADGRRYEGEYEANQKHGRGVYKWANGLLFTGTWAHGAPLAGFLMFPGGECAKTSCCDSRSTADACPDLALMRLQREAEAWIDARRRRREVMWRDESRAGVAERKDAPTQVDGEEQVKTQRLGLVGRLRAKREAQRRRLTSVVQETCPLQEGADGRPGMDVGGAADGSDGEVDGRARARLWWPLRRVWGHGRGPARAPGKPKPGGARCAQGSGGRDRRAGRGCERRSAHGGGAGMRDGAGGYSSAELEGLDGDESGEEASRECGSVQHGREDGAAGAPAAKESRVEAEEGGADARGRTRFKPNPARGGRGAGHADRLREQRAVGGRGQATALQEGDLWFYFTGRPADPRDADAGALEEEGVEDGGLGSVSGKRFNIVDAAGRSRIVRACELGLLDVVLWYVRCGWASANHCDADGMTPLHAACKHGHRRIASFLMSAGACSDVTDASTASVLTMTWARLACFVIAVPGSVCSRGPASACACMHACMHESHAYVHTCLPAYMHMHCCCAGACNARSNVRAAQARFCRKHKCPPGLHTRTPQHAPVPHPLHPCTHTDATPHARTHR